MQWMALYVADANADDAEPDAYAQMSPHRIYRLRTRQLSRVARQVRVEGGKTLLKRDWRLKSE